MVKKKKHPKEFYENKYNELKDNINLYTKKVPLYNLFLKNKENLNTNSWFDTEIYDNFDNDTNNYNFIDSSLEIPNKILKCDKIILLPTLQQKKLMLDMLEGYRLIYNLTLKFIKTREYNRIHNEKIYTDEEINDKKERAIYLKEIRDKKKNMSDNEKLCMGFVDEIVDNIFKTEIRNYKINNLKKEGNYDLILDDKKIKTYFLKDDIHKVSKKYKTPVHTLNYAVQLACASYKSCLTNLKNGNIKHFNVRYLKSNKSSLIMDIEKSVIKNNSFIISVLGKEIKNTENKEYITNNDCKLHYNKNKDRFTLLVPKEVTETLNNENKSEYISIDLGLRTLMNCKTDKSYIKIGNNIQKEIKKSIEKEDKYKELINIKKSDKERILKRIREKVKNKVNDLHWKTINNLTTNYKNIIIGKWSTKSIISREDSVLQKMNKRIIQTISYFKLLERLKFKCILNNSNLIIKEEWYTSKTCTSCGIKKEDLGGNKIYLCKECGLNTDRDYNGCRNIFLSCIRSIN